MIDEEDQFFALILVLIAIFALARAAEWLHYAL